MKRLIMKLSTSLLFVSSLTITATASADGFAAEYTTSAWQPHGLLVGQTNLYSEGLHPVIFTHINGRMLSGGRANLWLKPGEYTIDGTILPSAGRDQVVGATGNRGRNRIETEPLEIVVEDGKQYRIAGRYTRAENEGRAHAAAIVLWKVTDENGEERFPLRDDQEGDEGELESNGAERIETDSN